MVARRTMALLQLDAIGRDADLAGTCRRKQPRAGHPDPNFRDWFPHFWPDGKWIAFVSFGLDVALNDHPPNRDVMLRIMPADGSAPPLVLTRLFGGQGTINVPSWSFPDFRQIAFVSYRLVTLRRKSLACISARQGGVLLRYA